MADDVTKMDRRNRRAPRETGLVNGEARDDHESSPEPRAFEELTDLGAALERGLRRLALLAK
jgi:hypothetical protein